MAANIVYLGLGSNLADPIQQIKTSLLDLQNLPHTQKQQHSQLYRTNPLGPSDQPNFINAVVQLHSELAPEILLNELQQIEQQHGRNRGLDRWGPRTLDIDIMLYGNAQLTTANLTIPHPELLNRDFWLIPLYEIAPNLILPNGGALKTYVQQFDQSRYIIEIV